MPVKIQKPKGTADMLPSSAGAWHYTEALLREVARVFGFEETRFPTFESTELFVRGVGDTTDVVQKEMYTFEDKGGRSITLRPEGTASVVRSLIENSLYAQGLPIKMYYIAPNFRYEKPQAGRLREHHQFGIECFGAESFEIDAEIIAVADTFLKKLNIPAEAHINSIGCPKCRPNFQKALRDYFAQYEDELCPDCKVRLQKNPMRILDCKSRECSKIAATAPHSIDYLCDECESHFTGLKNALSSLEITYKIDTNIVRGLDYYTKTVFEFVGTTQNAQNTICGGGRYDGLVEQLGGPPTPGIGFGCGIERLIMSAEASGFVFPESNAPTVFVIGADDSASDTVRRLTGELRSMGVAAERDLCSRSVKAQMKHADRIRAGHTIVIGQTEIESKIAKLKDMNNHTEQELTLCAANIARAISEPNK